MRGVKPTILQEAYNRLRHNHLMEPEHLENLEKFTDAFVTCTRCVTLVGEQAVQKAEVLNWHGHSKSCTKGRGPVCRWKFPRYPLERTIFVDAHREVLDEEKLKADVREDILNRVMGVLVEEEKGKLVLSRKVKRIMISYKNVKETTKDDDEGGTFSEFNPSSSSDHIPDPGQTSSHLSFSELNSHTSSKNSKRKSNPDPDEPRSKKKKTKASTITYIKMESPEEYKKNIRDRIEKVLKIASVGRDTPITYFLYETAVIQQPRKGSEVLLRRDIDEIFINNYNPEWIVTWDANIDVSPVYDYYGTITYITDYFTKDSTGLTDVLKTAVKQLSDDMDMREKCHKLANMFMYYRQVGEAEVCYKLFANMNLAYSSVATIFVPVVPKGERRNFLKRQDPNSGLGFELEDKEGYFMEKPDLINKYERRKLVAEPAGDLDLDEEGLDQMCFVQFIKMYASRGQGDTNEEGEVEEKRNVPDEGELDKEDEFNYLVTGDLEYRGRKRLPDTLTLTDLMPGEPRILNKRTFPRAIRFFKNKLEVNPHRYYLAELMLYFPFRNENALFPDDPLECAELYLENEQQIKAVKAEVMPFLESVEEAQMIYEEMKAQEERDAQDQMGADLDPQMEQEIADLEDDDDDDEEHPDFYHIDLVEEDPMAEVRARQVFKAIALPSKAAQVILKISLLTITFYPYFLRSKRRACWTRDRRKSCSLAWSTPKDFGPILLQPQPPGHHFQNIYRIYLLHYQDHLHHFLPIIFRI